MYDFVFTHDAHVMEPGDLLEKNLPAKWQSQRLRVERRDSTVYYLAGDRVLFHLRVAGGVIGGGDISRSIAETDNKREGRFPGGHSIQHRLADMASAGIDSSIVFSGLTGFAGALEPAPGLAHMQVFNDWCIDHFGAMPHTFVPNAMLPAHSVEAALGEFRRVLDLGYRSVMLPIEPPQGSPKYVDRNWDPVWDLCEQAGVPMTMHSGSSTAPIRYHGDGAACMNYFTLGLIAQEAIAALVVGGVFDRHPKLKLVNCESGADWLLWVGERLDEVYHGHHYYVHPKLKNLPSETLYQHVIATTHRERGCIRTRHMTGLDCLMWSDDYPHAEGTFPNTKSILDNLFDGIEISPREMNQMVGGNGAKLYGLDLAKARAEKERFAKTAAM